MADPGDLSAPIRHPGGGRPGFLLTPEQHWTCPNCTETAVTHDSRPHSRFHSCRGLKGITAPLVADGIRCKVEAVEREDFTNGDLCQTDGEGRVVMAVVTTRDDGTDCAVLAPTATNR